MFNAIDLSESDPGEAKDMVDDVVKSMNSTVKAADGKEVKKVSIKSSDIHKVLWQAATEVMKGEAPSIASVLASGHLDLRHQRHAMLWW